MLTEIRVYIPTQSLKGGQCLLPVCKFGYGVPKILPEARLHPESLPAIPPRVKIAAQHTKESWPWSQSASPKFDSMVKSSRTLRTRYSNHPNPDDWLQGLLGTRDYDPTGFKQKRSAMVGYSAIGTTTTLFSHDDRCTLRTEDNFAHHGRSNIGTRAPVRTDGGAQRAPRVAHLNWREALQHPLNGQPSIPTMLYLCTHAFTPQRSPGNQRALAHARLGSVRNS